jgi:hypothetical protein
MPRGLHITIALGLTQVILSALTLGILIGMDLAR